MSNKLLPCPYCGATRGNALAIWKIKGEGWRVGCINEECKMAKVLTKPYPTEAEAIAAWNRRFVCPDKNGNKVYAGDKGKTADCKGKVDRLGGICIESEDGHLHHVWPSEIELIESGGEE